MEDHVPAQSGTRICLPAAVTVRNIETVREEILGILATARQIEIDCRGLTEADLSLVQLLIALRKSTVQAGITATLVRPSGHVLDDVLRRAGLDRPAQHAGNEAELLWLKGRHGDE